MAPMRGQRGHSESKLSPRVSLGWGFPGTRLDIIFDQTADCQHVWTRTRQTDANAHLPRNEPHVR